MPMSWWVLSAIAAVALFLSYDVALGPGVALVAGGLLAVGCGGWLVAQSSSVVAAEMTGFRAGRALLPTWAIGEIEALDADATALARGVHADPHGFFMLRGYVKTSVRVAVDDPNDPVPYWLVSTRDPQALAEALVSVRDGAAEAGH